MLGTAGYMAPEQIRGEPTDERADLFALGAMLFELLTGRRAFDRESRVETLNAILHDDIPALGAAAANVPMALDRIVRRCLEKDPDARFQSARDLAFALDTVAELATPTSTAVALPTARRRFQWPALAATVLVAIGWSPLRSGGSSLQLLTRHASWRASRCRRRRTCGSRAGR